MSTTYSIVQNIYIKWYIFVHVCVVHIWLNVPSSVGRVGQLFVVLVLVESTPGQAENKVEGGGDEM